MDDGQYIKPREVFKLYKITSSTIGRWSQERKVDYVENNHSYRYYNLQSIDEAFKNSDRL